jgi:protease-4
VAVIVAQGDIAESDDRWPVGGTDNLTPERISKALKQVKRTPSVEAAVLRINSPGGFALAGEEIHHELVKETEKLPLAVSMANIAASGGYYISTPAGRLFANGPTLTGSIGIYGGKVDLSGLYDKLDLHKELYTRGEYAGMMTTMRAFSDDEREKYRSSLMAFYRHFVDLVADNRSLAPDSIDNLSRGRLWTGRQALGNGLIDEVGGLYDALQYVSQKTGTDQYVVRLYPEERPLILLPGLSTLDAVKSMFAGSGNPLVPDAITSVLDHDHGGIFARMPFDIDIR